MLVFFGCAFASARSRSMPMPFTTSSFGVGRGRLATMVIEASLATHAIGPRQVPQRSSGPVANFITPWCSATSSICGEVVPQALHAYGSASDSTCSFGPRSSRPHSFSRNPGCTPLR